MGLSNMNPLSADSVDGWQERWCKYRCDVESKTEQTQFQWITALVAKQNVKMKHIVLMYSIKATKHID